MSGLEPPTSRLSGVRSNLLNYTCILLYYKKERGFSDCKKRVNKTLVYIHVVNPGIQAYATYVAACE